MLEQLSATAIIASLPTLTYNLPYIGEINLSKIIAASLVFVLLLGIFWILKAVILRRAKILAMKTTGSFDDLVVDLVQSIRAWVYGLVSLYVALQFFSLPDLLDKSITAVFYFIIVWQLIEVVTSLINYIANKFLREGSEESDPNAETASHMVTLLARILMWSLGILFVLSNIGIEVTSLIAGLGIGGVAVAIALQGILSDLFASFSLYFDKPFRIGDFVVIGDNSGIVERIGIKSTRIRTLQGEELVVSNNELTTTRVQNFKKMQERRVVMQFGIVYETPQERVREVPSIVTRVFEVLEGARLDRVHFTTFGDSALIFEVVYYVESSDYTDYLNIQQMFNFDLMERFAELGIAFAYPTQTIYTKTIS